MTSTNAQAALLRLLAICRGSFVQYLRHARPHGMDQADHAQSTLADVAADQDVLTERIVSRLEVMGVVPQRVDFPMLYTGLHDLSLVYLLERAMEFQEQDIAALQQLSESLARHQSIRSLVDEATGMAMAHLEALQDCLVID